MTARLVLHWCVVALLAMGVGQLSPDVHPDGRVTLRLQAPDARDVAVRGLGPRRRLEREASGVWSVTIDPLPPDIYLYNFVVDGEVITDPGNPLVKTIYPRGGQSLLHVRGARGAALWEPSERGPRGRVTRHVYQSAVIGNTRDYYVYTPPGYDPARRQPYPVLVLLHGLSDDASAWMTVGAANVILDNLIGQGRATPMVAVAPLGYGTAGMLIDSPEDHGGEEMMPNFSRALLEEVLPRVEAAYHVTRSRKQRAIAGLSMGGAQAVFVGLHHLETFASVASFSGAFNMWPGLDSVETGRAFGGLAELFPGVDRRVNGRLRLLWLSCGADDLLIGVHDEFTEWLRGRGVRFTGTTVPGYGHAWALWRRNLADLAARLFH